MIDLHAHTWYSDGKFAPAEVLAEAARRGVQILALTDHDNARGSREAAPLAHEAGIRLITGVEITTRWDGMDLEGDDTGVDLLAYGLDTASPAFLQFEEQALQRIYHRIEACCKRLSAEGCAIRLQDVFDENPRYAGLLQLIYAMLHKGCFSTWKEARDRGVFTWEQTQAQSPRIEESIAFIHALGGAAVLAHPIMVRPRGRRLEERELSRLVEAGLDGLEVEHYSASPEDRAHFRGLAHNARLIITGGSDLHGWVDGFDMLARQPVTAEMAAALDGRIARYRKNS